MTDFGQALRAVKQGYGIAREVKDENYPKGLIFLRYNAVGMAYFVIQYFDDEEGIHFDDEDLVATDWLIFSRLQNNQGQDIGWAIDEDLSNYIEK